MTLAGAHTADELAELLGTFDANMNDLQRRIDGFAAAWKAKNPAEEGAWQEQWKALRARYAAASGVARKAVADAKSGLFPMSTVRVENEYEGLRRALKRSASGGYETGDLQDLFNRLMEAMKPAVASPAAAKPKPGGGSAPKPKPKPSGPLAPATPAVMIVPAQAPSPPSSSSNLPWIAGGVAAVLATAILMKKAASPPSR